jgi:hypothetical protein
MAGEPIMTTGKTFMGKGRTNRNTGTWSEVVYLLRQQASFCRRRAAASSRQDTEIARFLYQHADICDRTATELTLAIRAQRRVRTRTPPPASSGENTEISRIPEIPEAPGA